ncbi:uncharacterized protein LOC135489721 [Lineus longissimus]|uniref:uncharacterized protein LOC135489721 n=1 Tax=Lineus longissimus TaxID=88925 RepID=UPI002B4D2C55
MGPLHILRVLGLTLFFVSKLVLSQDIACNSALGMASGGAINTTQMVANGYQPGNPILDKARYGCCVGETPGGFCAQGIDNHWFQIDFDVVTALTKFTLQPPDNRLTGYVKFYQLDFQRSGEDKWYTVGTNSGAKNFIGIFNSSTSSSSSKLTPPLLMRKIRFKPTDFSGASPCFRFELYGCPATDLCPDGCLNGGDCTGIRTCTCTPAYEGARCETAKITIDPITCQWPLGMKDGYIKDSQLSASSNNADVSMGRYDCCTDQDFGGWCPASGQPGKGSFYQIAFPQPMGITRVLTQKPHRGPNATQALSYVATYWLEYEENGKTTFVKYKEFGTDPSKPTYITAANATNDFKTRLGSPIYTKKLRVYMFAYMGDSPCVRLELYGCDPNGCTPPCLNGANCNTNTHKCICKHGYAGRQCELTRQTINHYDLTFFNLTGDTLFTASGTYQVSGNVTIQDGVIGKTLTIDTASQYVDLGNWRDKCMGDLELCSYGIGISLYVKFESNRDMYVLSSGGDLADSYGVAIYRKSGTFYFVASTKRAKWTMAISEPLKNQTWHKFQMFWKKEGSGLLEVYIDGDKVKQNVTTEVRNVQTSAVTNMYFGRSAGTTRRKRDIVETDILIEGTDFWEVDLEILTELEVVKGFPEMTADPKLTVSMKDPKDGVQAPVDVNCEMPYVKDRLVNYEVEWILDGAVIHKDSVTEVGGVSVLTEEILNGRMNINSNLRCKVRTCFSSICLDEKSPPRYSFTLQPEVELITPDKITIEEGGSAGKVDFKFNLPPRFFCGCNATQDCDMRVSVTIPKTPRDIGCGSGQIIPQAVIGWEGRDLTNASCGVKITDSNWNETLTAIIKAKLDGKADNNQIRNIELKVHCYYNETTITTSSKTPTTVQVTVIDNDKLATCQSINDPHMRTFDGRSYDNMYEGEFVLYRHRTLPYQVNTFYRKCGRIPSCNCAVAIKSGDDVIAIDRCGPKKGKGTRPITVDLYKNGDLTPGTRIVRLNGGNKYQVTLPPGNVITVQTNGGFLNVWMTASAQDFNQTEGLCGSYDGNIANDLSTPLGDIIPLSGRYANAFSTSWRENTTTSIYKGICPDTSSQLPTDDEIYCECSREWENKCGINYDSIVCPDQQKTTSSSDVTDYYVEKAKTPDFCKTPNTETEFEFDETWIPIPPTWPTPNGTTEAEATKYCNDYVQATAAAEKCGAIIADNMILDIEGCIEDIKLTDDKTWAEVAVASVKQACATMIEFDVTMWVATTDGNLIPPTGITDSLCLNDCSSKGTCKQGICQCNSGFVGPDCSININDPPIVITIPNGGLCEATKNCKNIPVYGEKFVESPQLTCHIQSIKISDTKYETVGAVKTVKGQFVNFNQVECEADFSSFRSTLGNSCTVAISNNGVTTSVKKVIYIIYNPMCQICETASGTCIIKDQTCRINGICYKEGDDNPADPNFGCFSGIDKTQWTHKSKLLTHVNVHFEIEVNIIITQQFNITVVGASPQIVTGQTGNGWFLNGSCLDFGTSTDPCFNDIDQCKQGITVSFWVKFDSIAENTYIISNGGQSTVGKGFAMLYRYGQLQVMFKNSKQAWYLPCGSLQTQKWTLFEMSWHETKGLLVYIDRAIVQQQVIIQSQTEIIQSGIFSNLMFGCPSPSVVDYSPIVVTIDEYQMWTVSIDILITMQIVGDRVTTAAPTTTSTTTTTTPSTTSTMTTQPTSHTTTAPSSTTTTTMEPPTTTLYIGSTSRPTCPSWCMGGGGFPTINKHPNLTYETTAKQGIKFDCNLPPVSEQNVEYQVEWLSGGEVIHTEAWAEATMTWGKVSFDVDQHPQAKLGTNFYCQIKARYGGQCKGTPSMPLISNKFIAKIEVLTTYLEVIEGLTWKIIKVKFGAPPIFFCDRSTINASDCVLRLEAIFEIRSREYRCRNGNMIHQAVVGWGETDVTVENAFCGILITNENWQQELHLKIKAKIDGKYDGNQIRKCDVVIKQIHQLQVVKTTFISTVTVKIINRDFRSICSSVNDPHMKTFDGSRYDNFNTGEFIIYRHKTRKIQVNGFYVKCSARSRATCNCGAAVMVGDDVVVFNKCQRSNKGRIPFMVYMFKNGQFTNGTRVIRIGCGNKYEVHLPTGTYVTVAAHGNFINIWVSPSAADYNQTEGLCGLYDQNRRNDLVKPDGSIVWPIRGRPDAFSLSWRVTEARSIFYGVKRDFTYEYEPVWCDCSYRTQTCGRHFDVELCDLAYRKGTDVTQLLIEDALVPNPPGGRKRRAAPIHTDNDAYKPIEFQKDFVAGNVTWPTESGWTEENATAYCTDYITNTQAAKNCGKLLNDSFSDEIASCVMDIKVSDDNSWAQAALDSITQDCTSEANKYAAESDNSTNSTAEVQLPGGVTLDELESSLCPQNCSGNGTCEGGRCVCFTDYYGDACELSKSDVPELSNMQRNGLCDVRARDCSTSIIYGTKFIESPDLTCKVAIYNLDSNTEGKTSLTKGTYVNVDQVICTHALAKTSSQNSFMVSVSNDGRTFSTEALLFVSYDSVCYTCTIANNKGSCQFTSTGCEIEGKCYLSKAPNPTDKCRICDPSVSINTWIPNPSEDCKADTSALTGTDIVVICVVAGVLILLLLITIIYTKCIREQPKKIENPSGPPVKFVKGKYTGSTRPPSESYSMKSETSNIAISNPAFDFEQSFDESEFNIRM